MMLVSAFMGKDRVDRIYAHAIAQGYRFFSYGDSSLLIPKKNTVNAETGV
jgi:S-adenosylmethionine:tRNA ribosyltransferase-isomerase